MANIDNVIKRLTVRIQSDSDEGWNTIELPIEEAKEILTMLKHQEPIVPYVGAEGITINCGNCGETVGYYPAGSSVPDKKCVYCPECGRKIKWND